MSLPDPTRPLSPASLAAPASLPAPSGLPEPGSEAHRAVLVGSGLFMPGHYLQAHPDLDADGADPLQHYCVIGWREGRSPNPWFDPAWYRATQFRATQSRATHCAATHCAATQSETTQPGATQAPDTDPLLHYVLLGSPAGARPNPMFDPAWYHAVHMAADDLVDPLAHYIAAGESLNHRPCLAFDTAWYRARHRLSGAASPLLHYLARRHTATVSPLPEFDVAWYVRMRRDVASHGADPFEHYLDHGCHEGQDPSPHFDGAFYASRYLRGSSGINPLLHYLAHRHRPAVFPTLRQAMRHDLAGQAASGHATTRSLVFPLAWHNGIAIHAEALRVFLSEPDLAFRFHLVWANERLATPTPAERDILQACHHDPVHDADICALARACFADPRYLRHAGRPLLSLHAPAELDGAVSGMARRWSRHLPEATIVVTRNWPL